MKKKSKDYALRLLNKQKENHRKMNNLDYYELKPQSYYFIEGLRVEEIQNVFRFRTRMVKVAGNYRGSEGVSKCPLCGKHPDVQDMMDKCDSIKSELKMNVDITNVYSDKVTLEAARFTSKLIEKRKELLETIVSQN